MKDCMGNTADRSPRLSVVGQEDIAGALLAAFADQEQVLLPHLELVENARATIDERMIGASATAGGRAGLPDLTGPDRVGVAHAVNGFPDASSASGSGRISTRNRSLT